MATGEGLVAEKSATLVLLPALQHDLQPVSIALQVVWILRGVVGWKWCGYWVELYVGGGVGTGGNCRLEMVWALRSCGLKVDQYYDKSESCGVVGHTGMWVLWEIVG